MPALRLTQYRTSPAPRLPLPFGARSTGYYEIEPDRQVDEPRVKPFVEITWAASGDGVFACDGRQVRVKAGELLVWPAQALHRIVSGARGISYFWFTLDGPLAGAVVAAFGLTGPWPRPAGEPPRALFKKLAAQLGDVSPAAERAAASTAFALLSEAAQRCLRSVRPETPNDHVESTRLRLLQHLADPGLSVEQLAGGLQTHRSLLSRQFRRALGLSPKQYLTSLRIQRAMSLLKESDAPVREVARQTGFSDPNYFARAFRRETGVSPAQFRNS